MSDSDQNEQFQEEDEIGELDENEFSDGDEFDEDDDSGNEDPENEDELDDLSDLSDESEDGEGPKAQDNTPDNFNAKYQLSFNAEVFEIEFHRTQDLFAVGLVTGESFLYKYPSLENASNSETQQPTVVHHWKDIHSESVRGLQFAARGNYLLSGSADKSIKVLDIETGKLVHDNKEAHTAPISTMLSRENDLIFASGDDEGVVKIWDLRQKSHIFEFKDNTDYISSMCIREDKHILLATGADGYLSVFQMRQGKLEARSDNLEDELLSVALVKNGSHAVVGTQEGDINIFEFGWWGDFVDRMVGHPASVSSIVTIDDDTICTASSDGIIRICSIHPNKLLGVLGTHRNYPIEQIKLSRDKKFLASCSHDRLVKFWDIGYLFDEGSGDDEDSDDENGEFSEGSSDVDSENEKKNTSKPGKNSTTTTTTTTTTTKTQPTPKQQKEIEEKKQTKQLTTEILKGKTDISKPKGNQTNTTTTTTTKTTTKPTNQQTQETEKEQENEKEEEEEDESSESDSWDWSSDGEEGSMSVKMIGQKKQQPKQQQNVKQQPKQMQKGTQKQQQQQQNPKQIAQNKPGQKQQQPQQQQQLQQKQKQTQTEQKQTQTQQKQQLPQQQNKPGQKQQTPQQQNPKQHQPLSQQQRQQFNHANKKRKNDSDSDEEKKQVDRTKISKKKHKSDFFSGMF